MEYLHCIRHVNNLDIIPNMQVYVSKLQANATPLCIVEENQSSVHAEVVTVHSMR